MDSTIFCQSDLPCVSFAAFEDMRRRRQFCDFTINVQNRKITAHRNVVAAAIPYFLSAFTSDVSAVKRGIPVEDLDPGALESLIDFAYSGKVSISTRNAHSLLLASQFLQLDQIRDACVRFITEKLTVSNVAKMRAVASKISNSNLVENCDNFIRKNFESFANCADFLSLSYSSIKAIISEDDLNVSKEEIVFEALITWVRGSCSERQKMLPDLLREVRMIYISKEYLMDKICSEELIRKYLPCRDVVDEAKTYHLFPERKTQFLHFKKQPRNRWNQFYVVCYSTKCGFSVHYFDITNEIWRPLSSLFKTEEKEVYGVVGVNEVMYIFLSRTIQTFRIKSREWQILKPRHTGMNGAAIVSNANRVYCFGSFYGCFVKKVRCFDLQRHEWLEEREMESNRCDPAAVSVGEFIYVTGGIDLHNSGKLWGTMAKYIPSTGQWVEVAPMLTPRCRHGCTTLDGKIYVSGGYNSGHLNTAELYDLLTDQWTLISCMHNRIAYITLVSYRNDLYAFTYSSCEIYDPKSDQWKNCSFALEGFCGAVCFPTTYA